MTASKNIGVDVDGILAIFDQGYTEVIIRETGKDLFPYKPYPPDCWEWDTKLGYTKEDTGKAWAAIKQDTTFWLKLPAYDDTSAVLKRLLTLEDRDKHSVYFITNRMGVAPKRQTENFLAHYGFPCATVLVSAKKGCSAQALSLDCYIDDKPENCVDVVNFMGTACKTYLMDRSWNQDFTDLRSIKRVTSVHTMLDEIGL